MEHPETFCKECGNPNPCWYAPNLLWNKICDKNEIICPVCFQKRADKLGINLVFTTEVLNRGTNSDLKNDNIKTNFMKIIAYNFVSMLFLIGGIYLAHINKPGWGWLIFCAVICSVLPSSGKRKKKNQTEH